MSFPIVFGNFTNVTPVVSISETFLSIEVALIKSKTTLNKSILFLIKTNLSVLRGQNYNVFLN